MLTSGECEIKDLFGFWSLLFDYMRHFQAMARLIRQHTDNVWIELGLNLESTSPPVDLAEILFARPSRVRTRGVNLEKIMQCLAPNVQYDLGINLTSVCP